MSLPSPASSSSSPHPLHDRRGIRSPVSPKKHDTPPPTPLKPRHLRGAPTRERKTTSLLIPDRKSSMLLDLSSLHLLEVNQNISTATTGNLKTPASKTAIRKSASVRVVKQQFTKGDKENCEITDTDGKTDTCIGLAISDQLDNHLDSTALSSRESSATALWQAAAANSLSGAGDPGKPTMTATTPLSPISEPSTSRPNSPLHPIYSLIRTPSSSPSPSSTESELSPPPSDTELMPPPPLPAHAKAASRPSSPDITPPVRTAPTLDPKDHIRSPFENDCNPSTGEPNIPSRLIKDLLTKPSTDFTDAFKEYQERMDQLEAEGAESVDLVKPSSNKDATKPIATNPDQPLDPRIVLYIARTALSEAQTNLQEAKCREADTKVKVAEVRVELNGGPRGRKRRVTRRERIRLEGVEQGLVEEGMERRWVVTRGEWGVWRLGRDIEYLESLLEEMGLVMPKAKAQ